MKVLIRNLNMQIIVDEYVLLDVVLELENGNRVTLTETKNGLEIQTKNQTDLVLVAANSFIIK